ncbi:Uncharacterised protein [Mycobacteroides abscessus]|nr:Uncharacterised protein [Mycobacteroides abscessus]
MRIIGAEHSVVEGLLIDRVCATLKQQSRQRLGERMAWLASWPLLALAEHSRQGGERGGRPAPQVSRVGVSAGIQQQARGGQGVVSVAGQRGAAVAQIHQRKPSVGATAVRCQVRLRLQVPGECGGIGGGRGRPDMPVHECRIGGDEIGRGLPTRWLVVRVVSQ